MRLEHISWVRAEHYFKEDDRVLLPLGSIESHGRHLPLGTDFLIPGRLVQLIEAQHDILVAPALPYGCCDYLADFPGTVSLGHDVLYAVLGRIVGQLMNHGARRIVILNGHGGNVPVIDRVALDVRRRGGLLARLDWWRIAGQLDPAWAGGHGGAEETAGVLAIDPALADTAEIADIALAPLSPALPATGVNTVGFEGIDIPVIRKSREVSGNGWVGPDHPRLATAQMGEAMLAATAAYMVRFLETFKGAAPEPAALTLTWLGHACFKAEAGGYAVVIDPYTGAKGYAEFTTPANSLLCSHGHGDHNYKAAVQLVNGDAPSPFRITALPCFHDDRGGALRGPNLIHLLEHQGLRIAHCGDLGHMPDDDTLAALRGVDALMVPVGGHYTIDAATAHALCQAVKPRVVLPMHYRSGELGFPVLADLDDFLALRDDVKVYGGNSLTLTCETPAQTAVLRYMGA